MRSVIACILFVPLTVAWGAPPPLVANEADILDLATQLADVGRQLIDDTLDSDAQRALQRRLKQTTYDTTCVEPLQEALRVLDDETVELYVAVQLFRPVLMGNDETVVAATELVIDTYRRLGKYEPLKQYSDDELAAMAEPAQREKESDEAFAQRVARHEKRIKEKSDEDRRVKLHNSLVHRLQLQAIQLMLQSNEGKYDRELIDWMKTAEGKNRWAFTEVLAALRTAARSMEAERAAWFYKRLKKYLTAKSMIERTYVDPSSVQVYPFGNSRFIRHTAAPGKHLPNPINHLAVPAGLPALREPKAPDDD